MNYESESVSHSIVDFFYKLSQFLLKYSTNVYPGISKYTFNCTENSVMCQHLQIVYELNLSAAWRVSIVMPGKCFFKTSFSASPIKRSQYAFWFVIGNVTFTESVMWCLHYF